LHLDDFGTGYSSLAALVQFPVQALKIDRGFINPRPDDSPTNQAIVRSTITLAHSLDLEVIAEGVETRAQLATLRELGCDCAQGYLFAQPLSQVDMEAWLASWDPGVVLESDVAEACASKQPADRD